MGRMTDYLGAVGLAAALTLGYGCGPEQQTCYGCGEVQTDQSNFVPSDACSAPRERRAARAACSSDPITILYADKATSQPDNSVLYKLVNDFYDQHCDNLDFLIFASTFKIFNQEAVANHITMNNEVTSGIGLSEFEDWNSCTNRLKGIVKLTMTAAEQAQDARYRSFLLLHEIGHQWAAYVDGRFGADNEAHFSNLLIGEPYFIVGGLHENWRDNKNGTLTVDCNNTCKMSGPPTNSITCVTGGGLPFAATRAVYSNLELYLMGLTSPEELRDQSWGIVHESEEIACPGPMTVSGTIEYFNINDIVQTEGKRVPDSEHSQKDFTVGAVIVALPNQDYSKLEEFVRTSLQELPSLWATATKGRSTMTVPGN